MRIAIDARLNAYRQGGIPQYTRQLITALADVATDDQIVSFQHRDQLRPLAIAVIGGVAVSMILSLVITPVIFSLIRRQNGILSAT